MWPPAGYYGFTGPMYKDQAVSPGITSSCCTFFYLYTAILAEEWVCDDTEFAGATQTLTGTFRCP